MFITIKNNRFLLLLVLTFIIHVSGDQESKNDTMCRILPSVLCVRDILMIIATVAKSINRTINEIERNILNRTRVTDSLNRYVNFEMNLIHSQLPTPQYHVQLFHSNNIDKKYLNDLFLEAHYAMGYYYNSIEDVLNLKDVNSFVTDSWFRQIESNLRNEMICQYRVILNVYSYAWPWITQIKRIEFSERKYRSAPMLVHDVHSVIIGRLLREWMQRIHSVIINLESKLF